MGKPAARVGDMHICPQVTVLVPHVGGPITGPGCSTVLIGGMPAAVMGDICTCTGPPDTIMLGSTGVLIGGRPAARMGDQCMHGGMIAMGCFTVLIGETQAGGGLMDAAMDMAMDVQLAVAQVVALLSAAESGTPFCEECERARQEQNRE